MGKRDRREREVIGGRLIGERISDRERKGERDIRRTRGGRVRSERELGEGVKARDEAR